MERYHRVLADEIDKSGDWMDNPDLFLEVARAMFREDGFQILPIVRSAIGEMNVFDSDHIGLEEVWRVQRGAEIARPHIVINENETIDHEMFFYDSLELYVERVRQFLKDDVILKCFAVCGMYLLSYEIISSQTGQWELCDYHSGKTQHVGTLRECVDTFFKIVEDFE